MENHVRALIGLVALVAIAFILISDIGVDDVNAMPNSITCHNGTTCGALSTQVTTINGIIHVNSGITGRTTSNHGVSAVTTGIGMGGFWFADNNASFTNGTSGGHQVTTNVRTSWHPLRAGSPNAIAVRGLTAIGQ